MTDLDALAMFDRCGFDFIAAAAGHTPAQLQAHGIQKDRAKQLHATASVLCGATSHTKYQTRAQEGAREQGHRLETLAYIVRSSRALRDATARWRYIEQLCNTAGDLVRIRHVAADLKAELQIPEARVPRARVTHHGDGLATLRLTGPAADVQGVYDAAKHDVTGWLGGGCPKADYVVRVTANLDLGDYVRIMAGEGDDVRVHFDNGVIVTGEEFVRMQLEELGSIILVGVMDGPVNAYHARFAHPKHREVMLADSTTCTWKGCTRPASECDAHHMEEHQHGGETTPSNLGWLCKYHNSQAARGTRGHTERRDGQIVYVSPYGNVTATGTDHKARAEHRKPPD
ncbi:HNH endonuclease signature motif containing protein [Corynebacterium sp. p3-SID1056]|uniref:HNH endonuclease signature motif containing protein n=1 Tax=Corynebacterium sp. p3-SID1056 TaxID=2916092 RepID=UPI0021A54AC2|nr:HNH endonuclease signature motif containing protein [Corynebacterium sp. p3-SID1056]MCT2338706.1 HNH endonuclease [Corynebacterium sp. p3-SID1056]